MTVTTHNLAIEIARLVDGAFPGWVECGFVDAHGKRHSFIDKVPIVSNEDLDATSKYPRPGALRCSLLDKWKDSDERELARITTASPDAIESTEGLSEFIVLFGQLNEDSKEAA